MSTKPQIELFLENENGSQQVAYPFVESDHVLLSNGMDIDTMIRQDVSMPTVAHEDLSFKVGVGDQDVSSAIVDSSVAEMTIKGKTYQNILPEPSTHVLTNNKEMFKVNEGLDPNVEIVDGVSKSAILKGQTLVNLSDNLETITRSLNGWYNDVKLMNNIEKLKRNTYYTILYRLENISGNHQHYNGISLGIGMNAFNKDLLNNITSIADKNGGWCKVRFQLTDEFIEQNPTYKHLYIRPIRRGIAPVEGEYIQYTIRGFAILEGDYITNHIPFNEVFEGMQSVKMPVLKATGKNLFDMNAIVKTDFELNKYQNSYYGKEFVLQPNTTYTIKAYLQEEIANTSVWTVFNIINNNSVLEVINIDKTGTNNSNTMRTMTFTTNSTGKVGYSIYSHYNSEVSWLGNLPFNIQLEKGSTATPYEPYKSNILTTPEDLELRGIGNVKDELDLTTGELTERIGEIVLDGSEKWNISNNYDDVMFFVVDLPIVKDGINNQVGNKNNKVNDISWMDAFNGHNTGIFTRSTGTRGLGISVDKKLISSVQELKTWLQSNPITVQYQLSTESIKTVDLSSSGNWDMITLNGSEEGIVLGNLANRFFVPIGDKMYYSPSEVSISCSSFGVGTANTLSSGQVCAFSTTSYYKGLMFSMSNISTVDEFKKYLKSNPMTIVYKLNDGYAPECGFAIFSNGHIIQSSGADSSLIPTLDYQAKTSNSYVMDLMKANTRYTMKAKSASGTFTIDGTSYGAGTNGTFTTPSSMTNKLLVMSNKTNTEVMILEGDVTDKTIPYFKGIKSAFEDEDKIEVLSQGKNLITDVSLRKSNGAIWDGDVLSYSGTSNDLYYTYSRTEMTYENAIKVKVGSCYEVGLEVFSGEVNVKYSVAVATFDKDLNVVRWLSGRFVVQQGEEYVGSIRLHGVNAVWTNIKFRMWMEEVDTSSNVGAYEPYKMNSTKIPLLSPLRSLPNGVCDEIILDRENNKATLIQRVGYSVINSEFAKNGEMWSNTKDTDPCWGFHCGNYVQGSFNLNEHNSINDKLPIKGMATTGDPLMGYYQSNPHIALRREEACNMKMALNWLDRNPISFYYQLATPVITEVDLEGFPYIYKDGHIFLNSEIVPVTEIKYSINQQHQIEASNQDIIRHQKEIDYLYKLIGEYVRVDYKNTLLSLNLELK